MHLITYPSIFITLKQTILIDRPTIERIKDAADIVDVVSEFVSLKKVGANYRGLCPFHNDHTPSFYVSPARRTCHCFVCGEGGDSVGFIMKHEQMTYPDALRWLANRYHIEIQEREMTDEQRKEQSERDAMFIVNEWAAKYFQNILETDIDGRAIGMQYFRMRGIRDDIIQKFRLGFCLNDRQALAKAAKAAGFQDEYLIKTGLCYAKDNGELMDRFAGRAMFPWIGVSGKVVAFGGRVLDSRTKGVSQKYVNSPDSPIYHKERELYGIFQAKKAIAKENCVYMVEGYTDVISMHQCGIENVVANSGTALSEHQIHILHRFTPNIVLLYDGDDAGIKAALRGTDMLLKEGMNVKVLLLPDGDDPDSFAKKHNAEEFRKHIEEHQTDFIEFKTKVLLDGETDPVKRSAAISSIIQSVSVIGDPIIRATYIQDCASRLGLQEQVLIAKMNDFIRSFREEERKKEDRERRRTTAPQQDYSSSLDEQLPPPDAFLPDDAFTTPTGEQPQSAPTQAAPQTYQQPAQTRQQPATYATPAQPYQQPRPTVQRQPVTKVESVEDMIMRIIMKHGEKKFFILVGSMNEEEEEGNSEPHEQEVTVAEYVKANLSADDLQFETPVYNSILDEAVEHSSDDGFVAEKYFTLHPDYETSQLAIKLTEQRVMLSKSLQLSEDIETIIKNLNHLLLDFRNGRISKKLETLRNEIAQSTNNPERLMELMKELNEAQKLRNATAQKIGGSILTHR